MSGHAVLPTGNVVASYDAYCLQKLVLTAADLRREAAVAAARLHVARQAPAPTAAAWPDSSPADLVVRLTQLGAAHLTSQRSCHHPMLSTRLAMYLTSP